MWPAGNKKPCLIPIIRRSPHERQPSRAVEVRDAQSYIVNPKHGAPITGQVLIDALISD